MTPQHVRFGLYLKQWREVMHMSQRDLAWRMQISQSSLAQLELGKREITLSLFLQMAKFMHMSVPGLLRDCDFTTPTD